MKKLLLTSILSLLFGFYIQAQDTIFFDNFESGMLNWTTTGTWGLSSSQSHSPAHSLSESPSGNYGNNLNTYCTMTNGLNLVHYPSAFLSFWGTYKIETGFDYMYVEASTDDFVTYTTLATFNGEASQLPPFQEYIYDLGGFCGHANVKIRFHFVSDGAYVTDGMYIDDFLITYSLADHSAPLIVHTPTPFLEGTLNNKVVTATITDYSGVDVANTFLYYSVDNATEQQVAAVYLGSNQYQFTIPAQAPGSHVSYYFYAEDTITPPNIATSPTYEYIAGYHIIQDNGQVDYYMAIGPAVSTGPSNGTAVKVTLGNTNLVGMLIRNYTDISNPNDSMLIHVWDDNGGVPGNDVITPFKTFPAATLTNTSPMKWIDLRPYVAQLSNLSGTYYIGFTVPSGIVNITTTQPGSYARSYILTSTGWSQSTGTNGANDYHFRAITSLADDLEGPNIVNNSIPVHYEANLNSQTIHATITDMTGVASSTLNYTVDNGSVQTVSGAIQSGNLWDFVIPAQAAGAWIRYWISATDLVTPTPYTSQTDTFMYISGVYHKFDNNTPNVYIPVGTMVSNFASIAEALDFGTAHTQLTTVLIRNYYSTANPANTPNNPMTIHVWNNNGGLPNSDLMTPFVVNSEASATNPMAITKVDLRPYSAQLSNITGIVYVGYSVANGMCAVLGDTNLVYGKTFVNDGTAWGPYTSDAQIRAITDALYTSAASLSINNLIDIYPNPTSDLVNVYIDNYNNAIINVLDVQGRIIYSTKTNQSNTLLQTSAWAKGLYFIQINNNQGTSIHKLVVK
jgi:hypothetical protein